MTDQVQAQPEQPAQQADLELQQRINAHLQSKAAMLNELIQLYSALTQKIAAFEVPVNIKTIGLQHFDSGFLWIKEAIQVAPIPTKTESQLFPQPTAPQEASPVEPAIDAA